MCEGSALTKTAKPTAGVVANSHVGAVSMPPPSAQSDCKEKSTAPNKSINPTVMSSGVAFNPQGKYWRIGGKWYDFTKFDHPGGREILNMARNRFNDSTYAFEAHHLNYKRARRIIAKYEVSADLQRKLKEENQTPAPKLLGDEAFYSDLRRRVEIYFRNLPRKRGPSGTGPTDTCVALFWIVFVVWLLSVWNCLFVSKSITSAVFQVGARMQRSQRGR